MQSFSEMWFDPLNRQINHQKGSVSYKLTFIGHFSESIIISTIKDSSIMFMCGRLKQLQHRNGVRKFRSYPVMDGLLGDCRKCFWPTTEVKINKVHWQSLFRSECLACWHQSPLKESVIFSHWDTQLSDRIQSQINNLSGMNTQKKLCKHVQK